MGMAARKPQQHFTRAGKHLATTATDFWAWHRSGRYSLRNVRNQSALDLRFSKGRDTKVHYGNIARSHQERAEGSGPISISGALQGRIKSRIQRPLSR